MLNTIFLIGYMGAGKSVVGKLLSQINGFNFYDLDEYIEAKEGKKVSKIFNQNNEVYFRKIENKYLKEISLLKDNKIISTGGGTPCFQNNFEIINESPNSTSIYLKANIDVLVNRLKDSIDNRPIISHLTDEYKLKEFITKHLFERNYYYEKSKIKIVTDNLEPTEIVKLIASKLA
ncbi:MAG: AAA family ATPase [Flavobacteriales bacterium]|mgnify:FL=1|nr:AAA family ATPase [Flavobacteriales bacterium]MBL6877197.1 AAA family ATPase [Flavobacteriales bacterium]